MGRSSEVFKHGGKQADGQHALANLPHKGGIFSKLVAWLVRAGVQYPDRQAQLLADDLDRLDKIGIIGN